MIFMKMVRCGLQNKSYGKNMSGRGLYPCISVPWLFCAPPILAPAACFLYDVTNWWKRSPILFYLFLKETKTKNEGTISILDSICSVRVFHLYWQFSRKWQKINWLFLPDLLSFIPQPTKEAWESSEYAVAG